MRSLLLWGSQNAWLSQRLPRYGFVQRAVRRFMPGEDAEAALDEAERLQREGIGSVLTLLGENVHDREDADAVAGHYDEVLDEFARRGTDGELSIKLTQLGLDLGREVATENLEALISRAAELGKFVWIDMEGSAYTDVTLDLFRQARERHANVGVCLQAYLRRTADDLESLLPLRPAIRVVKGAYAEPERLAFPKKQDVDVNFLRLAARLLEANARDGATRPVFGTHDERLIDRIRERAEAAGIAPDGYEFHMLYGIGRDEQTRLVRQGQRVRVLISYGEAWFPWYMRRLAERPANVGFVLKSLVTR